MAGSATVVAGSATVVAGSATGVAGSATGVAGSAVVVAGSAAVVLFLHFSLLPHCSNRKPQGSNDHTQELDVSSQCHH